MTASSYKGLLKKFKGCSPAVQDYFSGLGGLLNDQYIYEIAIAFLFLRTEKAHHRALYGGAVRLRRAEKDVTMRVVNAQHLSHDQFLILFHNIFGHELSKSTIAHLNRARKVRNKVVHGKSVADAEMRKAIVEILEYAEAMNREMESEGSFKPFGDMRGFKGRGQSLDAETTKWLLKGLGFTVT